MLEEPSITCKQSVQWHPNLQTDLRCLVNPGKPRAFYGHGPQIPYRFKEKLQVPQTGQPENAVDCLKISTTIPFGLDNTDTFKSACKEFGHGDINENFNRVSALVTTLKICAKDRDLHKGRIAHIELIRQGLLEYDIFVGTNLVNMYSKCGALGLAQQVFDELSKKDEVTWNTLIAGYVQHGFDSKALDCFDRMQLGGYFPTVVTYICALKACGRTGALDKGQEIHARLLRENLLEEHVELANVLVDMYAKCGELDKAKAVFDELQIQTVVAWTALIVGYAQHGYCREALCSFEEMQMCGLFPDAITISCVLQACGGIGAFEKGQQLHAWVLKEGLLVEDIKLANTLVAMYFQCGALCIARKVFDELPFRDIIFWNTIIDGYANHGNGREAFACIEHMQHGGLSPGTVTFGCILKACVVSQDLDVGQKLHALVVIEFFCITDTALGNAIVDMYVKCGALEEAQDVFDELPNRDVVSWNTVIAGCEQHGQYEMALSYFNQMLLENVSPDIVTLTCILRVCGSLGAMYEGQQLYSFIVKHRSTERTMVLGTSLIGMYANFGMLTESLYVFNSLCGQDRGSCWCTLLEAFTRLGYPEYALSILNNRSEESLKLDSGMFLAVLQACSHGGLLEKSEIFFELFSRGFGILPEVKHYASIVDIFCRIGNIDMAMGLIKEMNCAADITTYCMLLTFCQELGHRKIGTWAFERAVHKNLKDPRAFICISNIFSAAIEQGQDIL